MAGGRASSTGQAAAGQVGWQGRVGRPAAARLRCWPLSAAAALLCEQNGMQWLAAVQPLPAVVRPLTAAAAGPAGQGRSPLNSERHGGRDV